MRTILSGGLTVMLFGFAGCQSPPARSEKVTPLMVRFYLEARPGETTVEVQLPQSGVLLGVAPKPVFSEYDIVNAEVARVELGLCLLVQLSPSASRDLYRLSVPAQGRRLVLALNGIFLGVHRIEQAMSDGAVPVFLEVADEQLPGIVHQIKLAATALARSPDQTAKK